MWAAVTSLPVMVLFFLSLMVGDTLRMCLTKTLFSLDFGLPSSLKACLHEVGLSSWAHCCGMIILFYRPGIFSPAVEEKRFKGFSWYDGALAESFCVILPLTFLEVTPFRASKIEFGCILRSREPISLPEMLSCAIFSLMVMARRS